MKAAVSQNLEKRIVKQYGIVREAARDCAIVAGGNYIKQVAKLWHNLNKVAIHGKYIASSSGGVAIAKRTADPARRLAFHHLDTRLSGGNFVGHFTRPIGAIVIDDDDLVDVVAVHVHDCFY